MTTNTKTSPLRAAGAGQEWGRKARKAEAKGGRRKAKAALRAAIRKGEA